LIPAPINWQRNWLVSPCSKPVAPRPAMPMYSGTDTVPSRRSVMATLAAA
jgi:hypothetical protein